MRRWLAWRTVLPVLVIGLFLFNSNPSDVRAGTLTTLRDYLSQQDANLTSGEAHQIFLTPAVALIGSGNTLELEFPIAQHGTWCAAAGADVAVSGITNPEGGSEGATAMVGTLSANCVQGNGVTVGDILEVTGVGPLSAGTKYGVLLSDGAVAKLGTPAAGSTISVSMKTTDGAADVDTGTFFLTVIADDHVTITATVASAPQAPVNPIVQFTGRASLGVSIEFLRDGTLIQTVPTDPAAKFDVTLTNQLTGQHTYLIRADDADGRTHTQVTFALNLAVGSTTVISGVFLGPTIDIDKPSVTLGDTVTIFGKTAPSSTVTLTINSTPQKYNLVADGNGDWSNVVITTDVGVGTHTGTAEAISTDNTISETSPAVQFAVNQQGACAGKATADINCDGRVNLTDFSIMLFFWLQNNPSNARADINTDTTVTIVDFSILLFQWTG